MARRCLVCPGPGPGRRACPDRWQHTLLGGRLPLAATARGKAPLTVSATSSAGASPATPPTLTMGQSCLKETLWAVFPALARLRFRLRFRLRLQFRRPPGNRLPLLSAKKEREGAPGSLPLPTTLNYGTTFHCVSVCGSKHVNQQTQWRKLIHLRHAKLSSTSRNAISSHSRNGNSQRMNI